MSVRVWALALGAATAVTSRAGAQGAVAQGVVGQGAVPAIDSIFAAFGPTGPGCSVGVSRNDSVTVARAYGLADLEHDVPNTTTTIFEGGSLSKQVTAAAITLLALDGKLSLDDDARKYLPELPTYEAPITLRHLLNHTSGLRDWGNVADYGGWPRTTRVYTNELALDIARRQRALNYAPGTYYSYTNTGYNLLALIVGRVSGQSLAAFSRARLFAPLGMTRTSWRDDFQRVVKDRAIAYEPAARGTFRQDMPFENAYGNGGLLTTPSDLLRWTANLATGATVGGPRFVEMMHRQGVLTSGRTIDYASGIVITRYRGVREVTHSGSTAGYRAYLMRYPDQHVAIAVLCNAANANATTLAHRVADVVLGDALTPNGPAAPQRVDRARAASVAGLYRSTRDGSPMRVAIDSTGAITTPPGASFVLDAARGTTRVGLRRISGEDTVRYEPVPAWTPTATELAAIVGRYTSDEADADYTVTLLNGTLQLSDQYGRSLGTMTPIYRDAFEGPGADVFVRRDRAGRVTGLVMRDARVWALPFARRTGGSTQRATTSAHD